MRVLYVALLGVLSFFLTEAADAPNTTPPSDWQGIKFGAKRLDVETKLKAAFGDIRREGEITTFARTEVFGERVEIEFVFGRSSKTLCWVGFTLTDTPLDSVISAVQSNYGTQSSDTTIVDPWGQPHRMLERKCNDPPFSIGVTAGRDLNGSFGVLVSYVKCMPYST